MQGQVHRHQRIRQFDRFLFLSPNAAFHAPQRFDASTLSLVKVAPIDMFLPVFIVAAHRKREHCDLFVTKSLIEISEAETLQHPYRHSD